MKVFSQQNPEWQFVVNYLIRDERYSVFPATLIPAFQSKPELQKSLARYDGRQFEFYTMLADETVEISAGSMRLSAIDQGVFLGAVEQRIGHTAHLKIEPEQYLSLIKDGEGDTLLDPMVLIKDLEKLGSRQTLEKRIASLVQKGVEASRIRAREFGVNIEPITGMAHKVLSEFLFGMELFLVNEIALEEVGIDTLINILAQGTAGLGLDCKVDFVSGESAINTLSRVKANENSLLITLPYPYDAQTCTIWFEKVGGKYVCVICLVDDKQGRN